MSPGGHAATTAVAAVAGLYLTGSPVLTAGVVLGGFLIDVDHAIDYLAFEGQRDLRPGVFLRYHLEGRPRRVVLVLHSYESLAAMAVLAWWTGGMGLWGYVAGAVVHLGADMLVNGPLLPRNVVGFYSFAYRAAHRFSGAALHGDLPRSVPSGFWAAFFGGASPVKPRQPDTRTAGLSAAISSAPGDGQPLP